ncbi:MAG: hypothetical protein ACOCUI_04070 [bacterium]
MEVGDIVVLKTPKEIQLEYGAFNEKDFIRVGDQVYTKEMHDQYGRYLFSIRRIEGDRVIFFKNHNGFWYKVTKGMLKKKYKI